MRVISLRNLILAALLGWLASSAGSLTTFGQNGPARSVAGEEKPAPPLKTFLHGARSCANCHDNALGRYRESERQTMLCRLNEFPVWDQHDKHKNAFLLLSGDRGKKIGDRLDIDPTKSSACINCHGIAQEAGVETNLFDQPTDGVSCVACHGAYDEWVKEHSTPNKRSWRDLSRPEKNQRFGMTDLWDPVTRATKCASCHIGNPEEQKVVTHAMYAAGHPPLPGLETATFSDAQPRHWQYLREKEDIAKKDLGFNPLRREQTELVAVSGIVALRETMRLFAAQARQEGLVKEPETHWPDFARFDCYACHHDLQVPSWRQARGYAGRSPGRPSTPTWSAVLIQLGVTVADPSGEKGRAVDFDQKVKAFQQAMDGRPFGDRDRSIATAQALADWADEVSRDLREKIEDPKNLAVDGPLALRLLTELCRMAEARPLDYDSARQIALAFRTIYQESKAIDSSTLTDPAIEQILKALDEQAHLSLPTAGMQAPIEKSFPARLRAVFNFDPAAFQAQFAELARHL